MIIDTKKNRNRPKADDEKEQMQTNIIVLRRISVSHWIWIIRQEISDERRSIELDFDLVYCEGKKIIVHRSR